MLEAIEELGFEEVTKTPKGNQGRRLRLISSDNDPRWPQIIQILRDYGMEWYPHYSERRDAADKEYVIHRRRTYTREEICAAELLYIFGAAKPFADFRTDESGDGFLVEVNRRLGNRRDFGNSYYHPAVLMSERLKLLLEGDKLEATGFKPVRYDKPLKPDTKRLWQLESMIRMPTCLTQRQADDGRFVSEAGLLNVWVNWDDAGYIPAELVFSRSEVQKLPSFDIAMTQELVGSPYSPQREIIVTQRFREAMEKHGVKTAQWVPVRLI